MVVARINSITESHREERPHWVLKLQNNIHPFMMMVGDEDHHGLRAYSGRRPQLAARQVMRPQARWSIAR